MVRVLPIVGAAALFTHSAWAAAVPVRRTHDSGNNYNYNNYNSGSYNQGSHDVYQQQSNDYNSGNSYNSGNNYNSGNSYNQENSYNQGNNYGNNNYENSYSSEENSYTSTSSYDNSYNQYQQQESNQYNNNYNNYGSNEYTTTTSEESALETSTNEYDTTTSTYSAEETANAYQYETSTQESYNYGTTEESYSYSTTEESAAYETSTTSSSYSWPSYGSGSNNWNNGYNNCVQQCMAQFGAPPSTLTQESNDTLPPPTGTGAVHTILVAPEGAGLRYMPFAVNASIGDTIRYVWTTPNNHTATLSSALAICNKSGIAEQRNFVSGVKNASQGIQVFDVTVETSDPQFFYCSVAQHCQKGMFGIINPGSSVGSTNNIGYMMNSLLANNPQLQAAYSYMQQNVTGTSAENWGMSIPLDGIPESQYEEVAANVLFTQANFAANPGMLEYGQGAALPDGSPVQIVSGLNVLLSDTNTTPPSLSHSSIVPAATSSLTPVNANTSGAFSTRSVSTSVAAVVLGVASWLLL